MKDKKEVKAEDRIKIPVYKAQKGDDGTDLLKYFEKYARKAYAGKKRQSGKPTLDHFRKIVANLAVILKGTETDLIIESNNYKWPNFKLIGECVGWWHDLCEDFPYFKAENPYQPLPRPNEDVVYIKDLLANAGEEGRGICYCLYKLTNSREQHKSYADYMENIFTFQGKLENDGPDSNDKRLIRKLDVLVAIIKIVDRYSNTDPYEDFDINGALCEYFRIDDECKGDKRKLRKRLQDFYTEKKILEYFEGKTDFDPGHLVVSLIEWFEKKKVANALDNLTFYFPRAEARLFVELGRNKKGKYSTRIMRNKITFDYKQLKKLMIEGYENSLIILDEFGIFPERNVDFIQRLGMNRGVQCTKGYKSILKEIIDRRKRKRPRAR